MKRFIRCLRADFLKTKRLSLRIAHLAIPLCIAGAFLLYYAYAPWSRIGKVEAYFQVLGIGFPLLIGLFCAVLSEQEAAAAGCQGMLTAPNRLPAFFGKLVLLISMGAFSILLAALLFGAGNVYLLRQSPVALSFYPLAALILIASSVLPYEFHLFLALRFSKGVSIMTGVSESLIAALLLTGLGDRVWCFVPCAWAPRLIDQMLSGPIDAKCFIAILLCAIMTVIGLLLFGIWASRWEGQQTAD